MDLSSRITIVDKMLAKIFLPFIPKIVTPNHITAFRFATIPFVIYLLSIGYYGWGTALFIISAFSDALDGALARTKSLITDWGKMYDPLADKLLIGSVVVAIVVAKFLSKEIAMAIIIIELLIIVNAFWLKRYRGVKIQAKKVGKIKMILQSFGVGFVLLYAATGLEWSLDAGRYTLFGAIIFAVLSLFVYRSI